MKFAAIILAGLALILATSAAEADHYQPVGECSKACVERVKKRFIKERERAEWREYKVHPMPWCTWGPESGDRVGVNPPEWSMRRYRQPAIGQGPDAGGGKFQIIDRTWHAYGGGAYARTAYRARPLHQERVARRIAFAGTVRYRPQGLSAWVNC